MIARLFMIVRRDTYYDCKGRIMASLPSSWLQGVHCDCITCVMTQYMYLTLQRTYYGCKTRVLIARHIFERHISKQNELIDFARNCSTNAFKPQTVWLYVMSGSIRLSFLHFQTFRNFVFFAASLSFFLCFLSVGVGVHGICVKGSWV